MPSLLVVKEFKLGVEGAGALMSSLLHRQKKSSLLPSAHLENSVNHGRCWSEALQSLWSSQSMALALQELLTLLSSQTTVPRKHLLLFVLNTCLNQELC